MKHYTVKEGAILLSKSEETIRRWLRKGDVFPNAKYNSDNEGWKIPAADIFLLSNPSINEQPNNQKLTVSQVASRLGKSEETIKRWLRSGQQFPNAFKNSDVQGWRIPENDLTYMNFKQAPPVQSTVITKSPSVPSTNVSHQEFNQHNRDLVTLAYKAVTLTSPTEDMVALLSHLGIQRCLEVLLIMQQSPKKVRNVEGFIKKAIRENWSPDKVPIRLPRNQSKRLYELTQDEFLQIAKKKRKSCSQ
ncbi:helix-turn-helix domain-containing protein [Peribacillus frigoritolerans]|uniref:helix-turn-helix domain-containing protein n=1 Tax=Peribacillus frigoritolerans TaxID=450367 RepID=UPI002B243921|nr:helix-turn-helix domain-containing protein [Peribacillus frigoritolerans]MEB2494312.1 helix-turn-helix domain-containing protein [Peribacillus frigoritolerans]